MRKLVLSSILFCVLFLNQGFSQSPSVHSLKPVQNWIAECNAGTAYGNRYVHFIRLGDGTVQYFAPGEDPKPVKGIDHVTAIYAGTSHVLALKDDGTVWAWGRNDDGQLGCASLIKQQSANYTYYSDSDVPVQVTGVKNAIAVSAYHNASFALLSDGTVMAWGRISHSGVFTIAKWPKPAALAGITNGVALSGSMVLLSTGKIMAWGDGSYGRLGNGDIQSSAVPVEVKGISNAVAISSSESGGLALLNDGTVMGWGFNANGELGYANNITERKEYSTVPVKIKNISGAIAIAAHTGTCFALLKDGTVMGWGDPGTGALAVRKAPMSKDPIKLTALQHVVGIQAGNFSGMALLSNGDVMGWGSHMIAAGVYNQSYSAVTIASLGKNAPK